MKTAEAAAQLSLKADRSTLNADGQDLAFVAVEITDANKIVRPDAANEVTYKVTGPATIAAVGTADMTDNTPYQSPTRRAYQGRALVILRTTDSPGEITLTAQAEGLTPSTITLNSAEQK
jgi:beta-galactosidase